MSHVQLFLLSITPFLGGSNGAHVSAFFIGHCNKHLKFARQVYGGAVCIAVQPYLWGQSFFLGTSETSAGITSASRLSATLYDVNISDSVASSRSVSGSNAASSMFDPLVELTNHDFQVSLAELQHSDPT